MLDSQFQFTLMAIEERIRDAQLRNRQISGSGRRIFRIGRDRHVTRPVGRR